MDFQIISWEYKLRIRMNLTHKMKYVREYSAVHVAA